MTIQSDIIHILEKEGLKKELEAAKEAKRLEKEEAEKPEKEALDFYRQLEEEENKKKVYAHAHLITAC